MIEQRDLLLVPFPFSDQAGKKVRPVVVISNNAFNQYSEDVLVVAVTSNITKDNYTIFLSKNELEDGILNHDCCIKVENILKIDKKLIIKKIGKIKLEIFQKLNEILKSIIR
jgi:mRNA interferase MazF